MSGGISIWWFCFFVCFSVCYCLIDLLLNSFITWSPLNPNKVWLYVYIYVMVKIFLDRICALQNLLYLNKFKIIFCCFVLWPINVKLFRKLSHWYMFRHYRLILRQPVINTLSSYTSISNAAVGNTIKIICNTFYVVEY